jgi:hypothetical protein
MEDQRVLHYFISTVNNFQQCTPTAQVITPAPAVVEAEVSLVDPNQVDLEDLIAQVEAEEAMSDAVVTYTDPAGNTFEAPVVNENDPEDEEDLNDWMNLPLESNDEDEAPAYTPDENQEYTGENSSYMSLEVTPEETDQAEFDTISFDEKSDDDLDDLIFNIKEDTDDDDSSDFF